MITENDDPTNRVHSEVEHVHVFRWRAHFHKGFEFPCDTEGRICLGELTPRQGKQLEYCCNQLALGRSSKVLDLGHCQRTMHVSLCDCGSGELRFFIRNRSGAVVSWACVACENEVRASLEMERTERRVD